MSEFPSYSSMATTDPICPMCERPAHWTDDGKTIITNQICYVHKRTLESVSCLKNQEIRITDPKTGGQKGRKPEEYAFIPAAPLGALARAYAEGSASVDHVRDFFTCVEAFRSRAQDRTVLADAALHVFELLNMKGSDHFVVIPGVAYDRIPVYAWEQVARVYYFGAYGKPTPYEAWNWLKGYAWSLSFSAMYRHANKIRAGQLVDDESGLSHWAHVCFHLFTLYEFDRLSLGTDDRQPA